MNSDAKLVCKTAKILHTKVKMCFNTSIIFDGFDEWCIGFLARAERMAVGSGSFVCAIAYAGAESESLLLGVENFGFGEVEHIVGVKVFLEAVDVVINEKIYCERVGNYINFYCHNREILKLFL